jgi:glycolate oxidase
VLPETVEQVQAVLRVCRAHPFPVVPRGAGTGLSGGALPLSNGVMLVWPVQPDSGNRPGQPQRAGPAGGAQPGHLRGRRAHGLYYAPDPSSQIACSIGGNVAENSGGVHCLKYGLTVHNVLALKVLTMDGELLELGGCLLSMPRLRPAGADDRLGGPARHRHRSHRQACW